MTIGIINEFKTCGGIERSICKITQILKNHGHYVLNIGYFIIA